MEKNRTRQIQWKKSKLHICNNELFDYLFHVLITFAFGCVPGKYALSNANARLVRQLLLLLLLVLMVVVMGQKDEQEHRAQAVPLAGIFRTAIQNDSMKFMHSNYSP